MSEKYTLLVIEDELLLLEVISKKLLLSGVKVIKAASGKQALEYMKTSSKLPDAVWLDYHLPDMNGLQIMQVLKSNLRWTKIPVFVVSNSASTDKVDGLLGLGAKEYIVKAENKLEDIITTIIEFINTEKENNTTDEEKKYEKSSSR